MTKNTLQDIVFRKYPELTNRAEIEVQDQLTLIKINFLNKKYFVWIQEDIDGGYMTGINDLHNHYDLESEVQNLTNALDEFVEIVSEKIAVIGLKNKIENFLIGTMILEDALKYYGHEKPKVEIHTLNHEH